jgi:SAM-dependent methyltransferase
MSVQAFYDGLAPLYHLVYENWDAAVGRQGSRLASIIGEHWGADARSVLDAAVGIGTQAIGLLGLGFRVIGADLSPGAVARATREGARRRLMVPCLVADFRALPVRGESVDVVLVCDNALPHLETEGEIQTALAECLRCARPGGGCLISMRDYGPPPPAGTVDAQPWGERVWAGRRYRVRQVWTWHGRHYELAIEIVPRDSSDAPTILRSRYLAIPVAEVAELMRAVGFERVRRLDDRFFQPVLIGTRPTA